MANFRPFNEYTFFLLSKLIKQYDIKQPFLDAGCGIGELSKFLVKKGWSGKAIDYSKIPLDQAKLELSKYSKVQVELKSFFDEKGRYNSIFMWDVLEHIYSDQKALTKLSSLLNKDGFLIISVPSNPKEWQWDDEFYGHYRRYTKDILNKKLEKAGLRPIIYWDSTYPIFWAIRRIYLRFKNKPNLDYTKKETRTKISGVMTAWRIPVISDLFNNLVIIWRPIYWFQYYIFRNFTASGFGILVLAQKVS